MKPNPNRPKGIAYTPLDEAKDASKRTIEWGDVCVYMPKDSDSKKYRGMMVVVRDIKAPDQRTKRVEVRIDNDVDHPESRTDQWTLTAWATESELILATKRVTQSNGETKWEPTTKGAK